MRSNLYKTAVEYLNPYQDKLESTLYKSYDDKYKEQNSSSIEKTSLLSREKSLLLRDRDIVSKNKIVLNPIEENHNILRARWEKIEYESTANPEFWGPSFWLTLHNGALRYPNKASNVFIEKMKGFVKGIPYMVPCSECKNHADAFIDNLSEKELNEICSGKDKLFKFFVDFHNNVNERYFKRIVSYEEAYKLYNGKAQTERLIYK